MTRDRDGNPDQEVVAEGEPPDEQHPAAISIRASAAASFSGPLPPPRLLKEYEEASPGSADRIIRMAETEETHRQAIETRALEATIADVEKDRSLSRLSLIFGALLVALVVAAGCVVAIAGHPTQGMILCAATVVSLASVFVLGRRDRESTSIASRPIPRPED